MPEANDRVFNDDLLANRGDVEFARKLYPTVGALLDWPEMRAEFRINEAIANQAKRGSRVRGVSALAVALLALWLAVLQPHLRDHLQSKTLLWALTALIALLGLIGVILGSTILIGSRKERWLSRRVGTERLRQLHFQTLVRRALQIASADAVNIAAVISERQRTLDILQRDLRPGVTNPVDAIISDLAGRECWLVESLPVDADVTISLPVLDELFQAYASLRFQHQINYATKKLSPGSGLWPWEPGGQAKRIHETSYSLMLVVIVSHIFAVFVVTLRLSGEAWLSPTLEAVGILSAMTVLALRVLEDGIRPRAEVMRLEAYRGEVVELFRKFQAASDPELKLGLMERLEEVSYRELRDFLTLHDEASFVL